MSEELKKLEELLANDRKIIEDNYKEIERLNKCYCERTDCSGRIKNSKKYESVQEENERLHSIIKEVREYRNVLYHRYYEKGFDTDSAMIIKELDKILDKEKV